FKALENLDYTYYVGPLTAQFQFSHLIPTNWNIHSLYFWVRPGGPYANRFDRASIEVGLHHKIFGRENPINLFLMYFKGYGENLLDYDQLKETYRAGSSLDL
ncbi:MAG: phospholipase A, partial [Bdellovibrionales bacterium]|nr:phospholipase A [Bdellovibrionales bacterium]